MIVSYRTNGDTGVMCLDTQSLSQAFNYVAQRLVKDALLPADYGKSVRLEGKVKIDRKNYAAVTQAGLVVVERGPDIPDRIEVRV